MLSKAIKQNDQLAYLDAIYSVLSAIYFLLLTLVFKMLTDDM